MFKDMFIDILIRFLRSSFLSLNTTITRKCIYFEGIYFMNLKKMYKLNHKCFDTVIQTLLFEQSVKEDKILVCRKDNLIHNHIS